MTSPGQKHKPIVAFQNCFAIFTSYKKYPSNYFWSKLWDPFCHQIYLRVSSLGNQKMAVSFLIVYEKAMAFLTHNLNWSSSPSVSTEHLQLEVCFIHVPHHKEFNFNYQLVCLFPQIQPLVILSSRGTRYIFLKSSSLLPEPFACVVHRKIGPQIIL